MNTNRRRFLLLTALGVSGSIAGCLGRISNAAHYDAVGPMLEVDYDAVMDRARAGGYDVDEPYYVNAKKPAGLAPSGIERLDRELGPSFRVFHVSYFFSDTVFFELEFTDKTPRLVLADTAKSVMDDFDVARLPPTEWFVRQLVHTFDMSNAPAREYVHELEEVVKDGAQLPTVSIPETPNFRKAYEYVGGETDSEIGSDTGGDGWYSVKYFRGEASFAAVDYIVQSMKIGTTENAARYTLKLDRLGGFRLQIELDAHEEIPEDAYLDVFRRMFTTVGMPVEVLEGLVFEYTPSIW